MYKWRKRIMSSQSELFNPLTCEQIIGLYLAKINGAYPFNIAGNVENRLKTRSAAVHLS